MKMIREIFQGDSESGFTLVELLVSLVITAILAVGVTRILSTSMKTIDYTQTSTLVASNNALIESIVSEDIAASNAFIIPNTSSSAPEATKICTSWKTTDTAYSTVRPLLTLSVPSYLPIISATGKGSTILYTLALGTQNTFEVGQSATIYGIANSNLTVAGALITAKTEATTSQPGTFTVATSLSTTESETPSNTATAAVNWYRGYEVRNVENLGELWSFSCPVTGLTTNLKNFQVLRQGLPLSTDASWSAMVKCTQFTGASISASTASSASTTCPTNTALTSIVDNPGIQFIVPPATKGSRSNQNYKIQIIQGARSIA